MPDRLQTLPETLREERTFFRISSSLADLPRARLTPKHLQLLDYWSSKTSDGSIPPRSAIDPLDIPKLLPNLLLWDVGHAGEYVCRLSGSEIDTSMGMPIRGARLSDMACPLIGEAIEEFDAAGLHGLVSFAERTMGWLGKPYLYYRHLILPLTNGRDEIRMLASCMTFSAVADLH